MVHQAGGDLHDMPTSLLLHLGDCQLSDVEEAGEIDCHHGGIVGAGVLGEWLGDENTSVVDERVDPPKPVHSGRNGALGRLPIGNITRHCDNAIIGGRLH